MADQVPEVVIRTVRVTRTWNVAVPAIYGDNYQSLCAKVTEDHLDDVPPDDENRVVLEEHDSEYEKWHDRPDAPSELTGRNVIRHSNGSVTLRSNNEGEDK